MATPVLPGGAARRRSATIVAMTITITSTATVLPIDSMKEFHTAVGDRVTGFLEVGGRRRSIAIDQARDGQTIAQARELAMAVLEAAAWLEGR